MDWFSRSFLTFVHPALFSLPCIPPLFMAELIKVKAILWFQTTFGKHRLAYL